MKGKKLFVIAAATLLSVTALSGCKKKKVDPTPVDPEPVEPVETNNVYSVSVSASDTEIVNGDTEYAAVSVVAQGKAENLKGFSIVSDNPEVLSIDPTPIADGANKGKFAITANGVGKAKLVATSTFDNTVKGELEIKVVEPYVKGIELSVKSGWTDKADDEIEPGLTVMNSYGYFGLYIEATISVKDHNKASGLKTAGIKDMTFTSKNTEVANVVVDPEEPDVAYIAASALGEAEIECVSNFDNTIKESTKVYAKDPYIRTVSLNSNGLYLIVDDTEFGAAQLEADITGFDAWAVFGYPSFAYEVEYVSSDPSIATVDPATGLVTAVAPGTVTITATSVDGEDEDNHLATASCTVTVKAAGSKKPADGAYTYMFEDAETRTEILGALEKYAVENKLTGLTMYGDGGYVMYHPSVQKGTNQYVPGFGFGIQSSGRLTADLEGENKQEWKRYYHTTLSDDPGTINYMDDKGSVVGNLIGNVSASYYDTFLNEEGNGYEWVGSLSTANRPVAVNLDAHNMATTWRVPVKVGAAAKYSTMSNFFSAYNNREVALEDYVTPYKIYYTQQYGLARSAENLTGAGSIKGTQAFYKASKDGFSETAWANVGIKTGTDATLGSYLEFEFNQACTQFYAMYYLASSMFAPVPEAFVKEIGGGDLKEGVASWGKSSPDGSRSPMDNWLCTGPYMFEAWDSDQQIVMKRNPNWNPEDTEHYKIDGLHYNVLAATKTDPEANLNQFLANKIHATGIPSTKLEQYKNDPRACVTGDDSTYKLNLNTCDQNTWNQLFGVNGTITQTPKSQYWACEPAMNNKDFVSGLSFALNRKQLAETLGSTPSANFFGNGYMSDPENGIAYNSTQAHKDAVASLVGQAAGTDEYGYSLEKAKASFKAAAEQLIADGYYTAGETIHIEIAWQSASQVQREHSLLKNYFESAFNVDGNPLRLSVDSWTAPVWSDVYYKKMMVGQFDIGFGSVSGNSLNPLSFLNVLSTDPSINEGFCLNWGLDTNSVDGSLIYDNLAWSFDALWQAAEQGTLIEQGANAPINYTGKLVDFDVAANGDVTFYVDAPVYDMKDGTGAILVKTELESLYFYGYPTELSNAAYKEVKSDNCEVLADQTGVEEGYVRYAVTFNAATLAPFNTDGFVEHAGQGYGGIDLYFHIIAFGAEQESVYETSITFYEESIDASAFWPAP